jgi:hypothetical protein
MLSYSSFSVRLFTSNKKMNLHQENCYVKLRQTNRRLNGGNYLKNGQYLHLGELISYSLKLFQYLLTCLKKHL